MSGVGKLVVTAVGRLRASAMTPADAQSRAPSVAWMCPWKPLVSLQSAMDPRTPTRLTGRTLIDGDRCAESDDASTHWTATDE